VQVLKKLLTRDVTLLWLAFASVTVCDRVRRREGVTLEKPTR
jgi:hypothetical protein